MKNNNITELCALLWAMHTPESIDNPDLCHEINELHKLVGQKAQTEAIQGQIKRILGVYTFLEKPYLACQQALAQQTDNNELYQALIGNVNVEGARNQPPPKKTLIETDRDKGYELDNLAVEIADHLKNCYSPDSDEKGKARTAIALIKIFLF